jgi:hypothetical protein
MNNRKERILDNARTKKMKKYDPIQKLEENQLNKK